MIWLLLLFVVGLYAANVIDRMNTKIIAEATEVVPVKQCPPHKWQYVEVKDTEGNTVKWKIVCDICGPMVAPERPQSGDYS